MKAECHAHIFMDGINYRRAVEVHEEGVNIGIVKKHLQEYKDHGIAYVRDGGDRLGVSQAAAEIAEEYGIRYRTPIFAIHRKGHYGRIVGRAAEDLKEYAALVREVKRLKGNFIKIMVSGIMDYSGFGLLTEPAREEEWIREMIRAAHGEGMSVMVHGNGREAVLPAVLAGADSIEHGNYLDSDCLDAMAERGCILVPTVVTTKNLIGCGRYEDEVLHEIYRDAGRTVTEAFEKGVPLAVGSDAGAYMVGHGQGALDEEHALTEILSDAGKTKEEIGNALLKGTDLIMERF